MPTHPLISNTGKKLNQEYSHSRMDSILHTPNHTPSSASQTHSSTHNSLNQPPVPNIAFYQHFAARKAHSAQTQPQVPSYSPSTGHTNISASNSNHGITQSGNSQNYEPQGVHRPPQYDFDGVTDQLDIPITGANLRGADKQTKYQFMPFTRERIYANAVPTINTGTVTFAVILVIVGLMVGSFFGFDTRNTLATFNQLLTPQHQVAQAKEIKPDEFTNWARLQGVDITNKVTNGNELMNGDSDQDGLTNYDEYLLKSNPIKTQSCQNTESDYKALIDLINPGTCREINWSDSEEVQNVINVTVSKDAYKQFIDQFNPEKNTSGTNAKIQLDSTNESKTIIEPKQVQSYISKNAPNSPISSDLIITQSNLHTIKPELLLSIMQKGSLFGTASDYSGNNLTGIGSTKGAPYSFENPDSSLVTTAQLIHYLSIRSVPDCAQITLIYGGDYQACKEVRSIYQKIDMVQYK